MRLSRTLSQCLLRQYLANSQKLACNSILPSHRFHLVQSPSRQRKPASIQYLKGQPLCFLPFVLLCLCQACRAMASVLSVRIARLSSCRRRVLQCFVGQKGRTSTPCTAVKVLNLGSVTNDI